MWRVLLIASLGVGCTVSGAELIDTTRTDAQTAPPECRVDNTICAGLVAPELLGTPQYLRAHLVQRVAGAVRTWEVAYVARPDFHERSCVLVIPQVAHEGTYYLAVTLVATTCAQSRADAELQDAPAWLVDSIEHVMADEFDMSRAERRATSWFDAQQSRRTAPVETRPEPLFGESPELPLVRGHADLEYAGWAGPFLLDGTPVNLGIIELEPCVDRAVEKVPLP